MLTAAEIKLVAAILLALLVGWAVTAWRERPRVEIIPIEPSLKPGKAIRHFEHRQE